MHHSIPAAIHLKTNFLCEGIAECNQENFFDFPHQHGFDVDQIIDKGKAFSDKKLDQCAGFLQAWLIFGLIRQVLHPSGIYLNIDDFVFIDPEEMAVDKETENKSESDDVEGVKQPSKQLEVQIAAAGDKMVMTDRIPQYMLYWIARESHIHDIDRKDKLWNRHKATFHTVESTVNKLILWRRQDFPMDEDGPGHLDFVLLSIILLAESIFDVCKKLFAVNGASWDLQWELDHAMRWYLLEVGWCPGEITQLHKQTVHATNLYSTSSFDRHCLGKDHALCNDDVCLADQIDESRYETQHVFKGCDCSHIGESHGTPEHIANRLNRDAIPVIRMSYARGSGSDDMFVSVQDSTDAPFVAISHVWSDGLGNAKGNTLPRCQIHRLQSYVNALYPNSAHPVSFWIDTICVPRALGLRRKAIWLMETTYRSADKVLVLDDWLIKTGLTDTVSLDLLKVKACSWSRRLWTLHESVLTREGELYFQSDRDHISETEFQRHIVFPGSEISYMADFVKSEEDNLCERFPEVAAVLMRAHERWVDIQAQASQVLPKDPLSFIPAANSEFPWAADWAMLSHIGHWYTTHFAWVEGRNSFESTRHPIGHPDIPVLEANAMLAIGYGMRFRSTSWIEDEPICLATLLGQDPKALLAESTLEGRMKVLVSQMKHAPHFVLFSPLPRIDVDGFRWAPLSFKEQSRRNARSPGITFSKWGKVRPDGFLVTLPSLRLNEEDSLDFLSEFWIATESHRLFARVTRSIKPPSRKFKHPMAIILRRNFEGLEQEEIDAVLTTVSRVEEDIMFANILAVMSLCLPSTTDASPWQQLRALTMPERQWCIG